MMYYGVGFWIIVGLIALVLFGGLIVALVAIGVSTSRNRGQSQNAPVASKPAAAADDPLEILRRRYARGEITREEFQSMRDDLIS
jgi:putative membrane protein